MRERELRCACKALGLLSPILLDYQDGQLSEADPERIISEILAVVREVHPQMILTYGPEGVSGHPDHIAIGSFAAEAFLRAGDVVAAGDVVILITGSGNSRNLIKAAELSRARGAKVVGLLGFDGGKLKALCDESLLIASDQYGVIEDMHMSVAHILTFYLKQKKA